MIQNFIYPGVQNPLKPKLFSFQSTLFDYIKAIFSLSMMWHVTLWKALQVQGHKCQDVHDTVSQAKVEKEH